jgi:2-desacetyl-2-hydroxyethyl bacteriochlorophyllide A dehydrogenase
MALHEDAQPLDLPAKMRGIIFPEKGRAAFQQEPTPGCSPGTVLCQSLYTGLTNGTERNVLMGGNYGGSWPSRCGYQNVGRVLAVGDGAQGYQPGEILFSGDFCQHTQYFAAPAAADRLVVKVPAAVDPRHAALFGVASVALHDVRRAEVRLGENVLVVGAGSVGQFTAQYAKAAGARVTVCELDDNRLEIARRLGAHATVNTRDDAGWALLREQYAPFDVVFEDSGAPVLDRIIGGNGFPGLVKHRGKVVMIAGRDRVTYSFNAGQGRELTILHAGHFQRGDLEELVRLVSEGTVKVGPILRDVVPIAGAIEIYDRLRDDASSLMGTVFEWLSPLGRDA